MLVHRIRQLTLIGLCLIGCTPQYTIDSPRLVDLAPADVRITSHGIRVVNYSRRHYRDRDIESVAEWIAHEMGGGRGAFDGLRVIFWPRVIKWHDGRELYGVYHKSSLGDRIIMVYASHRCVATTSLAHELAHAIEDYRDRKSQTGLHLNQEIWAAQTGAVARARENAMRALCR